MTTFTKAAFMLVLGLSAECVLAQAGGALVDLGAGTDDFGTTFSSGKFINDSGQVAGLSRRSTDHFDHAFFWNESGGMVDILASSPPILGTEIDSTVEGLTSSGAVLGSYDAYLDGSGSTIFRRSFVWSAGAGLVEFTLPGDLRSLIRGISKRGNAAAGISYNNSAARAFYWSEQTGVLDLGVPPGTNGVEILGISHDGGYVVARGGALGFVWTAASGFVSTGGCLPVAVNDHGVVAGVSSGFPCAWSPSLGYKQATVSVSQGSSAIGMFINNAGEVAVSNSSSGGIAGYWTPATGVYVSLGGMIGSGSDPSGLSESGLMVGVATLPNGGGNRAFVSQSGGPKQEVSFGGPSSPRGLTPAGRLVGTSTLPGSIRGFAWGAGGGIVQMPVFSGANISDAADVNNRGQVTGVATLDAGGRESRAVIWNTGDADGDGILDASDPDDDNDGVVDGDDALPFDHFESLDTDHDGIGNNADPDDDNDGVVDVDDEFPLDPLEWLDSDNDGIGNNADPDDDNDTITDVYEVRYGLDPLSAADAAGDFDNDGLTNLEEFQLGTAPDNADTDHDGIDDKTEVANGTNPRVNEKAARTVVTIVPQLLNE